MSQVKLRLMRNTENTLNPISTLMLPATDGTAEWKPHRERKRVSEEEGNGEGERGRGSEGGRPRERE